MPIDILLRQSYISRRLSNENPATRSRLRGTCRSDPSRHARALGGRRGDGHRTRRAVRHDAAFRLETSEGSRACRPDLARAAAQTRPCRLEPAPLKEIADWMAPYRQLWDESFDRLDAYLQASPRPSKKGKRNVRTR